MLSKVLVKPHLLKLASLFVRVTVIYDSYDGRQQTQPFLTAGPLQVVAMGIRQRKCPFLGNEEGFF